MAFKFPLQTVLRYREELEKNEERILEEKRDAVARLENRLAEIREQRKRLVLEREILLQRGTLGDDLHFLAERQSMLEQLEETVKKQIQEALAEFDRQMQIFLAARQKREILNELKINQKEVYETELERREQATIDELFISRMKRNT